jgi:hypothetical protein
LESPRAATCTSGMLTLELVSHRYCLSTVARVTMPILLLRSSISARRTVWLLMISGDTVKVQNVAPTQWAP